METNGRVPASITAPDYFFLVVEANNEIIPTSDFRDIEDAIHIRNRILLMYKIQEDQWVSGKIMDSRTGEEVGHVGLQGNVIYDMDNHPVVFGWEIVAAFSL